MKQHVSSHQYSVFYNYQHLFLPNKVHFSIIQTHLLLSHSLLRFLHLLLRCSYVQWSPLVLQSLWLLLVQLLFFAADVVVIIIFHLLHWIKIDFHLYSVKNLNSSYPQNSHSNLSLSLFLKLGKFACQTFRKAYLVLVLWLFPWSATLIS